MTKAAKFKRFCAALPGMPIALGLTCALASLAAAPRWAAFLFLGCAVLLELIAGVVAWVRTGFDVSLPVYCVSCGVPLYGGADATKHKPHCGILAIIREHFGDEYARKLTED